MNIVKPRDVSTCEPSSKEQEALCDGPKGLKTSACNESFRVVEAVTQEAQFSKCVTLGKTPYGKKAALELTCVCQSKKGATQSGIMDFLTVQGKKQDFQQDKSMNGRSKGSKMQMNGEAELHRSTRITKPFNEKEETSLASTLNLPSTCEGYALKKEDDQKLSLLNPTGFTYNHESELIQSDFFVPASKKFRFQRRQEAANVCIPDCTRASKRDSRGLRRCMPNDVKEVRIAEATSRSKLIILKQSPTNEDFFRPASKKQKQTMNKEVIMKFESITKAEIRDEKYFEFDLQMEAKRAAEENAQLCAGKPTHPFFSQRNIGPRACTFWDASFTPAASMLEVEDLTPAPPFHINQLDKECEAVSKTASFAPSFFERKKDQPVFKAGVSAKSMEKLRNLLKRPFLGTSCKTTRWVSQSVGEEQSVEPFEDKIQKWTESRHDEKGEEDQFAFTEVGLEERLKVCCADHAKECSGVCLDLTSSCTTAGNTSRNSLWTDAYQPQLPEQVYGNKESVKSLSEWLQNWKIRCTSLAGCSEGVMFHRTVANGEDSNEDKGWSEEDSDGGENTSNEYFLPNVLVLAGPVGCGKTAAIYACAKAHGYTVIEVNCSENRSGTLIKQKFGEAMESHRVGKWSADDATVFPLTKRHSSAESNACRGNTFAINAKKEELVDGKKNSSNVAANIDSKHISKRNPPPRCTHLATEAQQLGGNDESGDSKGMTILLFEDVDLVFEDDQGFMAAVAHVATSAKRPIILTSNDKELCLPHNLCSNVLEFNRPSTEDLMSLAYLVCISEGSVCSPELLQKVVNVCKHDARKMLNYLQFWCQGKFCVRPQHTDLKKEIAKVGKDEKESEMPPSVRLQESDSAAITYLFDLEAQHRLWPACIDLDFPCKVTESVSSKLSETVSEAETKHRVDKEKKLVQEVIKKRVLLDKMKRRMIDSPPNVWFNHPYEWEGEDMTDEFLTVEELGFSTTPVKDLEEAKTMVQSPVWKRKTRRQLAIVLSESDDDTPGATHKKRHHEGEQHSHVEPEPLSSLTSLRTSREMGSINGENAPVSSGLHAEAPTIYTDTNSDATQTLEVSYSKKSRSSTSKCLLEELGSNQAASCSFPDTLEPVYNLWSYFQTCSKNKDEFLLSPTSKESFSVVLSLSDLSDNLSACDIMSFVHSCKQDVMNETLMFSSHENPECCDWSPVCAQIAHESFQMCLRDSRKVAGFMHEDRGAVLFKDMLLAVNDPLTLGKLATDENFTHQGGTFCGQVGPLCEEQDLRRLQKMSSLQNNVFTELPPTAQRSFQGAAFYEHLSFLARMGHLEQDQLALGSTRPRAGGLQSLFCSHPWNLSENSITILQSFGIFGRQGIVR